ncbi:MAG: DUF4058 family protein [Isosphaerales bacterium]
MPSPFPGMDPYLENPRLWPDVHHNLISGCQEILGAQLRPKYVVRIEERVYIGDESDDTFEPQLRIPDVEIASRPGWEETSIALSGEASQFEVAEPVVATTWFEEEIHEAFLKITDLESSGVVTVIEILSPTNKVSGSPGRKSFEQKRREVMYSPSHWVEIDLLRGKRMVRDPKKIGPHSYLVHVSKRGLRPRGLLYPIRLPRRLPVIPIPLKPQDPDARLDLQAVLDRAYDRAGYDLRIDYRAEPRPPLDGELATWADQLLRSKGLR